MKTIYLAVIYDKPAVELKSPPMPLVTNAATVSTNPITTLSDENALPNGQQHLSAPDSDPLSNPVQAPLHHDESAQTTL
jgi:hypothetical protein